MVEGQIITLVINGNKKTVTIKENETLVETLAKLSDSVISKKYGTDYKVSVMGNPINPYLTLTSKCNGKEINIIYEKIGVMKYKEEGYIQCKFGDFRCIYCTHGGCSKK